MKKDETPVRDTRRPGCDSLRLGAVFRFAQVHPEGRLSGGALQAAGLMLVMVGGFIFNVTSGVIGNAVSNVILFVLAAAVAYLRWRVRPLKDRGAAG